MTKKMINVLLLALIVLVAGFSFVSCATTQNGQDSQSTAQIRMVGRGLGVLLYKQYSDSESFNGFISSLNGLQADESDLSLKISTLLQLIGPDQDQAITAAFDDLALATGLDMSAPVFEVDAFQLGYLYYFLSGIDSGWQLAAAFSRNNPGMEIPLDLAESEAM